jgi:hypothetical protein
VLSAVVCPEVLVPITCQANTLDMTALHMSTFLYNLFSKSWLSLCFKMKVKKKGENIKLHQSGIEQI